ncbi:hypothetical protein HF920_10335 [Acidithiobacillus ferriphilus]|nr:hypothetical protein [Acidithiobacillus ferriphilus]MBU2844514.1 hypothetical protein [Acidithiobacillus ferriphilus]
MRLPKGFEINADEVLIRREGDTIILTPTPRPWNEYFRRNSRRMFNKKGNYTWTKNSKI